MKLVSLLLPLSFAFSITLAVSNSSFYIQSWSLTFQNVWNDKLDRLWLTSFHTGAGLSDPTFTNNSSLAKKFYINDTVLHMETGGEISWGFVMGPATNYAAWEPVQLNAGAKTPGFYINDTDGTNYQGVRWNSGYPYVTPPGQANQHVGWVCKYNASISAT